MITTTDLHIQFKLETGEDFQYNPRQAPLDHSGTGYNSERGYTGNYAVWVEEQLLNKNKDTEIIKKLENELAIANEECYNMYRIMAGEVH